MKDKVVSFRVTEEEAEMLQQLATKLEAPQAEVLRQMIKHFASHAKQRKELVATATRLAAELVDTVQLLAQR